MEQSPFNLSMLASWVSASAAFASKAFFWIRNPSEPKENVTFGFEYDSVYVAARSKGNSGVYNWAIIARPDGGASLQVRDQDGAVSVDLLSAIKLLNRLIEGPGFEDLLKANEINQKHV